VRTCGGFPTKDGEVQEPRKTQDCPDFRLVFHIIVGRAKRLSKIENRQFRASIIGTSHCEVSVEPSKDKNNVSIWLPDARV
jgi:hypothetical protein